MSSLQRQEDRLSVAEFRQRLAEQIDRCSRGRNIIIASHGKPKAVLISYAEYLAFTERPFQSSPQVIDVAEWEKGAQTRGAIADSIASLFDIHRLRRKGQKGYKSRALKEFEETPKRTGKRRRRKKP